MKKLIAILFMTVFLFGCNPKKEEHKETEKEKTEHQSTEKEPAAILEEGSYVHPDGTICHAQSPINILSFNADSQGMHNITFNFKDEINAVENLGHTVQLDFKEGSTITVDGETFNFRQLHFHTPSEHLIDGVTYPMEMHMVNTLQDQKEGETPQFLVIGALFKMGKESKFISEFINSIPEEEHEKTEVIPGQILVGDLFSERPEDVLDSYYHYMGSLTTPPYTESVRWYVSKHIFEASPQQIKRILEIEGANARHVQSLNDRTLESN
ncbi:carbonic anhydrase family protein [Leptobacterium flavescens]|uniref:Carbonic anhydrase n=1 Tax=Leptobacterium flavescens TaxID=472055 RepID=A0A6P0UJ14_9FLAO|nr:carbonic anhydrase family protein [Leptobacterium flavescens]NER13214.1 carbonic anhydrase family protein [Leptobacterium flavescens]